MIGDGDFDVFFNTEEFGEVAQAVMKDGSTFDFKCQFFLKGVQQSIFGQVVNGFSAEARTAGTSTTMYCSTAATAAMRAGRDKVRVSGKLYTISKATPDGTGMSTMMLVEAT